MADAYLYTLPGASWQGMAASAGLRDVVASLTPDTAIRARVRGVGRVVGSSLSLSLMAAVAFSFPGWQYQLAFLNTLPLLGIASCIAFISSSSRDPR